MTKRVCLSMIVRNEEAVLPETLRALLPYIDCYSIVDTGSADNTVAVIEQYLGHLPGVVTPQEWSDFSTARNLSLEIARQFGDYVFICDADDIVESTIDGTEFRNQLVADVHNVVFRQGSTLYHRPLLIRSTVTAQFRGVVHEFLAVNPTATGGSNLKGFIINYNGAGISYRNQDQAAKYNRDVQLIQSALLNCDDQALASRYTFYLASSLQSAGRLSEAVQAYGDRTRQSAGYTQEVYISFLRMGHLARTQYSNPRMQLHMYMMAYEIDPTRAEAQHYVAELARHQQWWNLAWLFVNDGLQRSPDPTKLFLESEIYNWRIRYEQSIAGWYVGQFEIGRTSCEWLLARSDLPTDIQEVTAKNLELYRGAT
jgi:glycosyltransferase involved in cell wall biosynthesis